MKYSSIRILLNSVAKFDLKLAQMNMKTPFLHDDLDEDIYLSSPNGYKLVENENLVCKLNKSLYGSNYLQDYGNVLTNLYRSTSTEEVTSITMYIFGNSMLDPLSICSYMWMLSLLQQRAKRDW